ncbi:PAS domain-containing protein [Nitrospira defluvii]|uniref:histidine kinase n=1 Tax=Nitrospira defluvii TaxID=330214 RepID=A0ABM8RNG1_9BACT|nr:PAS domain S-box protein [Nitrospira defluvii]CAE6762255.1 putative Histidine kinase [Nitrospira defluvii]
MYPLPLKTLLLEYGGPALLTLGIFLLDLSLPAEYAVWLLYAIPLALTAASSRTGSIRYGVGLVALLVVIGAVASPSELPPISSWINRLLGIGLLVTIFTFLSANRRNHSVQAFPPTMPEPAHKQSTPAEAAEAIAHAEAAVEGAMAGQRRAEAELQHDKLRFEGIVQSAMDAIITVDDAQKIVLFNQAAEDMFQWSAQDMLGRPLDRLIPERFRSAHAEHIREFGRSGITTRQMGALGVIMGVRSSGEEFPIEAAISQIGIEGLRYYTVILRDITERKRLEEDLAEREALLRAIIETEPECVKVLALDGTVQTINAAGLAMVEATSPTQVVGKDVCHLVAEEFQPVFRELVRQAAHGEAGRLEFRLVGFLGTPRWLDTHVVPLRAPDGSVSAVLGVTRDVTEWKKTEQLLRQSEERYRRLLAVLPDAILVNRGGRIVFINEQGLQLFGASQPEDILGRSLYELVHADFHDLVRERIRHLLDSGSTVPEVEEKAVRLDGTIVDVAVRAARFQDEAGAGILVVLRDLSMRKVSEQRLRESEERLQSLLGAMEDVIWSASLDWGTLYYVSPSVMEIYGRSTEEFLAQPSLRLAVVHEEDRALADQALSDLQRAGEFDVEYRIVRLDGEVRWLHDRGRVIKDEAGHPLRIDGIASDITERKRLQAQLRRTERVAELGTVASGMAHEIGTPMNVILGRAEYLMERTKEEPVRKGLQTIISQVERITRVMNQLLAFARRRPVEHRALDLHQIVEDNLEIFQERLSHSHITVETSFAEACPLVRADADQMSQVLINLVMNAIHAMPGGGVLKVALAPATDRGMVMLVIGDTGHGMPKDVIAKIFDPFFTTKEFGKGTGLGLTVVRGIIEEHGGTIQVESEPGVGTVFTICLPIQVDPGQKS